MSTITGGGERPPMRNRLAFALDLARLVTELERLADWSPGRDWTAAAAAESYLDLLCRLSVIDSDEEIAHAVTRATETFNVTRQEAQAQVRGDDPR